MHRVFRSRWLLSITVGIGVGVALARAGNRHSKPQDKSNGLLDCIPIIPIPSVNAATKITPHKPGQIAVNKSTDVEKYGFPSLSNIKTRESYVTSYDPRNRTAAWVIEQLNAETLTGTTDRKSCKYQEDELVHVYHRSTNADYKGSGFDKGHLAAAANHKWSQKAMQDTFYLSNMSPQNPHLNQHAWFKLEEHCRSLTKDYRNVFVCTGPLYLPQQEPDGKMYVKYQVLGENHVAVPTHFFKVLILEKPRGDVELQSYVMANMPIDEKIPLERFLVPIESIERASGLLFVPNIMKKTSNLKAITA